MSPEKHKEHTMKKTLLFTLFLLLGLSACTEKKVPKGTKSDDMKCGAGKCGAGKYGNSTR
jgi:hypothetical protein